ncbi:alpha/beta-hydrolase [Coniochaeta ligniaria NRRL 30616]|uniref:Alpha/beta-hydrolase n=1 Tax=Coniochaeta ligniaria NRRL 30616 TaxID=1408157 RepID=A0A1J7J3I3_9PEZI|nr:alpha/beta-hydrolase [Coniochaeta ligniaria NRRL 30616]
MIDHVLGRPSVKSRRLQVLAVLAFWSTYLFKGNKHGPPVVRFLSRILSKSLTAWQTVVITMLYLYAARNFSTLVGLASPEPLANMYDKTYFRATWVLTALDAGFWTAMKIRQKWLRDIASMVFSVFYMVAAEQADEKVRKVRGNLTVEHLRISWNKGTSSPYLRFFQGLMRPRFTRWPPRQIRIPRPSTSDFKEPVLGWLYYDGPISDLVHHNKIVLDIPGGGFVAMDPRANDDKLSAWAAKTGLPVLSLDYKKAPEYPYPYALNECYDVYTTLIKSKGRCIGMSGKEVPKIIVSGDSAGGNLAASMTLMIIETGSGPVQRFQGEVELPPPDALVLFYPALDMNIGNWMSEEQMALINDRRARASNKNIIRRKSTQYNLLAGTPHESEDEDDTTTPSKPTPETESTKPSSGDMSPTNPRTPNPEFAHPAPTTWTKTHQARPDVRERQPSTTTSSHHAEPLRTRLATSSMISYFNDRVLTPEMMRAMIILYVGPHNRPDFSQDYLLCPILAPSILLARFPKTYFLTGERDPLVDDTVIFAGRLRRVKAAFYASGGTRLEYHESDALAQGFDEKDVAEVALIPGISHGFLQFPTVYPPAWKLIDRSARWIEDGFAAAERRRERLRRRVVGGAASAAEGRHHLRQESSGEDDRPLEMGMTKARGRSGKDQTSNGVDGENNDANNDANGEGSGEEKTSIKKKKKRVRTRTADGETLVKLNSSDDLLSRRMMGLMGGLTGLGEDK